MLIETAIEQTDSSAFPNLQEKQERCPGILRRCQRSQRSTAEVLEVFAKSLSTWISRASDQSEVATEIQLKDLNASTIEMMDNGPLPGKRVPCQQISIV